MANHKRANIYSANFIGERALALLRDTNTATILGCTSKGIYIRIDPGWVIFFSNEKYRSPITVNLNGKLYCNFESGKIVKVQPGDFLIFDNQLIISIDKATCWDVSQNPLPIFTTPLSIERIIALATGVAGEIKGQLGYAPLLPILVNRFKTNSRPRITSADDDLDHLPNYLNKVLEDINALLDMYRDKNFELCVSLLEKFLGKGRGLTPSGDDFLVGLLLMLNHMASDSKNIEFILSINQVLKQQALVKTTTLSANLIELATSRKSDERLSTTIDCIFTGIPEVHECTLELAGMGNSSGADSLAGIITALLAIQ